MRTPKVSPYRKIKLDKGGPGVIMRIIGDTANSFSLGKEGATYLKGRSVQRTHGWIPSQR